MRASRCKARRTYCRTPRRASLAGAPASAARATAYTRRRWCNALCRERYLRFVRIFGACFNVVFRGQKICLRYFKIGQTYFEICALYFFFAPMWGKHTENQFSIFRTENDRFCGRVFQRFGRDKSCSNHNPGTSVTTATTQTTETAMSKAEKKHGRG